MQPVKPLQRQRRGWTYDEEQYLDAQDFYRRVENWYKGALDLCPGLLKDFTFPLYTQFYSLGGVNDQFLLQKRSVEEQEADDAQYLNPQGQLPTINMGKQPVIATIYGPTGCGKSHLLRAILSCNLLQPIPENVIFITPEKNMVPPVEQTSWNLQMLESNFECRDNGTFAPRTNTFRPRFIEMTYDEATDPQNLNIDHADNVFARLARQGPIAVIMDECMDRLCSGHSISVLFHALPSKLFARSSKCTAFYVLVVLHNMAPRTAIGNVPTLKINSKIHIISCSIPQFQFSRFLYSFSHHISKELAILLKAYFSYLQQTERHAWIMYTTEPISDSFRWTLIDQKYNLIPLNINVQQRFLKTARLIQRFTENHSRQLKPSPQLMSIHDVSPTDPQTTGETAPQEGDHD